ncbi:sigma factor [Nesterenkonia natronophila]|uniref:RNA polymerase sigma-70 region 2 domain-containing protein n=1 Tax=Nesterenkonia natronophila TaxID=2174932 RepID=A0A3A4F123_9MICC|nr:sigma factor [Nesterenkonia natronophila]RJN31411.1 hypothetical protein D3250_11320 [Nesterenkonia natronophila]
MDEALLRDLVPQVLGVLIHRGADFPAAEDAVQEALVEAMQRWPGAPPRNPKGWLVTVAELSLSDIQEVLTRASPHFMSFLTLCRGAAQRQRTCTSSAETWPQRLNSMQTPPARLQALPNATISCFKPAVSTLPRADNRAVHHLLTSSPQHLNIQPNGCISSC